MISNFRNKVFNEDVLKVLKTMPDNSLEAQLLNLLFDN